MAELKVPVANEGFGGAVSVSGSTAVVGEMGSPADDAYVFTKTATGWKQTAELKGSDTDAADGFGTAVAVSGATAIVGAFKYDESAGRAYVFTKTATGWRQAAELKGSDTVATDQFGDSVSISGSTAVVGAPSHADSVGRAYVFTKTATGWAQTAELKGSGTVSGSDFGFFVANSGTTALVGAPFIEGPNSGRAYVFTKTATGWKQTAELKASNITYGDDFGFSVAISNDTAVVGGTGAAVFTKAATGWKQTAELKGSVSGDAFGDSVAISGPTAIVAAYEAFGYAGRAYLFTRKATGWKQIAKLKGSDTVANDFFGESVAISGTTTVVGAPYHNRVYVFQA